MPTSLGPAEILVILVVALIVLGPERLPKAARQIGKAVAEVRHWSGGIQDEVRNAFNSDEARNAFNSDEARNAFNSDEARNAFKTDPEPSPTPEPRPAPKPSSFGGASTTDAADAAGTADGPTPN